MTELWRNVVGYEGIYEVSNIGRVRTCEGKTTESVRHGTRHWKQRIIKQKYGRRNGNKGNKDARVILWKDKKWSTHLVSRLVARAWCDGYADGLTVNHIDGNPLNNRLDNLEWCTIKDNIRKGFEDGLYKTQKAVTLTAANGERLSFRSMAEASRYLGRNNGYISNVLASGRRSADGYAISA